MPEPDVFQFDNFVVDAGNALVSREDQRLHLTPKLFDLLCYLVRHAGQLLTKDQLMDAVWGHLHISESALKTRINELRNLLGDDAKSPRYIETVTRRGYRFLARVTARRSLDGDVDNPRVQDGETRGTGSKAASPTRTLAMVAADPPGRAAVWSTDVDRRYVTVLAVELPNPLRQREPSSDPARDLNQWIDIALNRGGLLIEQSGHHFVTAHGLAAAAAHDVLRVVEVAAAIQDLATPATRATERSLRIGIATGSALVARPRDTGATVSVRGAPIIAAKQLATAARPGQIAATDAVYRACSAHPPGINFIAARSSERDATPIWRIEVESQALTHPIRSHFVGRDAERALLRAALAYCRSSNVGRCFLLRGEAGIGKTRLIEQIALDAAALGIPARYARSHAAARTARQGPIATLMGDLLLHATRTRSKDEAVQQGVAQGIVGEAQVLTLKDWLDLPLDAAEKSVFQAMDGHARRDRRRGLLTGMLEHTCRETPLLVTVEDLHWETPDQLDELLHLAQQTAALPFILVMTTRPDGDPFNRHWNPAQFRSSLTTLDLGLLRDSEALELARQFVEPFTPYARQCLDRAGGHPLFLEQLIQSAPAEDHEVPDSIQALICVRLDTLVTADKLAAQAAAVLGHRFDPAALGFLIDTPGFRLDTLIRSRLVIPDGSDYQFAHALIADSIYNSLLPGQARALHRRAAAWFGQTDLGQRAEHLAQAQDAEVATAFLAAARQRAERNDLDIALQLIDRGLSFPAAPGVAFELHCLRGDLFRDTGRTEESLQVFEDALMHAAGDAQRGRAWIGITAALRILDQHDDALRMIDQAVRSLGPDNDDAMLTQIHYHKGSVLFTLGRIDDCLVEQQRAYDYALRAQVPAHVARALSGLGDAYYQRGQMTSAHGYYDRCVGVARAHALVRVEIINLALRGYMSLYRCDIPSACADLEQAIDLAQRVGDIRAEAVARLDLGIVLLNTAQWQLAYYEAERGLQLSRRLHSRRFEAGHRTILGTALASLHQQAEGERELDAAHAINEEYSSGQMGPWTLGEIARVTRSSKKQHWALAAGECMLARGSVGHNHLHFRKNAMEVALVNGAWPELERHALALSQYIASEPLPWASLHVERAHALANFWQNTGSLLARAALQPLRTRVRQSNLLDALPGIEDAIKASDACLAAPSEPPRRKRGERVVRSERSVRTPS